MLDIYIYIYTKNQKSKKKYINLNGTYIVVRNAFSRRNKISSYLEVKVVSKICFHVGNLRNVMEKQ